MSLVWQLKGRQHSRVDEGFFALVIIYCLLGTATMIAVRLRDTCLSHSVWAYTLASQSSLETIGCVPIADNHFQPKESIGSLSNDDGDENATKL